MPAIDIVKTLHAAMIDTLKGYEKAEAETDSGDLKALFADMVAMRRKHHEELHRALVERGEAPNDDGSFLGVVHKTVIGVRAKVIGIGRDALSAFVSGEEKNLADYDEAIAAHAQDPELPDLLRAQKAELEAQVARMKRLSDAA